MRACVLSLAGFTIAFRMLGPRPEDVQQYSHLRHASSTANGTVYKYNATGRGPSAFRSRLL